MLINITSPSSRRTSVQLLLSEAAGFSIALASCQVPDRRSLVAQRANRAVNGSLGSEARMREEVAVGSRVVGWLIMVMSSALMMGAWWQAEDVDLAGRWLNNGTKTAGVGNNGLEVGAGELIRG